jgi:hypothetical protein
MQLGNLGNLSGYELHRLNGLGITIPNIQISDANLAAMQAAQAEADKQTKIDAETKKDTETPKVAPNNKMLYLGIGGVLIVGVAAYFLLKDDEKVTVKPKRR